MLGLFGMDEHMGCVVLAVALQRVFHDTAFSLPHVAGFAFLVSTRYVICNVVQTFGLGLIFDAEF